MTDRLVDPTRQGIDPPAHRAPDDVDWTGRAKPVPLAEAIAMVDAWPPNFAPFTMHQMCRALRQGIEESEQRYADLAERWGEANAQHDEEDAARLGNLRRENESLRFRAAQSGVALVDGPDIYGSRIEGFPLSRVLDLMDAWRPEAERWGLHQMCRVLRAAYSQAAKDADCYGGRVRAFAIATRRMLAAVPCTAGIEDCHAPYYRHQPCCNLRVGLWPGEEFPTDYLPDSGEVHLFAPGRGDKPRVSAGCVKLIEPTDWTEAVDVVVARRRESALDQQANNRLGLCVEPTIYERNETLDWDRSTG